MATSRVPTAVFAGGLLVALALSGCRGVDKRTLSAQAADEWTRSYPLAPGGEFQIVAGNGSVDVTGGDGTTVDVRAERIAHAATEAAAREVVPRIQIREDVQPEKVVLQTVGLGGIVIGIDIEVRYHVTVPRSAKVRVRSTNGALTVSNVEGGTVLNATNGDIVATGLQGPVDARAMNGKLSMDLASFAGGPVDLRATNGAVQLSLPQESNATLGVSTMNGTVSMDALKTEPIGEQTRRRHRVRLNAGGAPIEIIATNGDVRVIPRP